MQRSKPNPSKPQSEATTVELQGSPTRCPYCHDACRPDDDAAIVCQACLSRHHGACWREGHAACSSCGSTKALRGGQDLPEVAQAELELLRRGLPRQAVERLTKRVDASELQATTALLEAASQDLDRNRRLPPGAIVALVAVVLAFLVPILAIIFSH